MATNIVEGADQLPLHRIAWDVARGFGDGALGTAGVTTPLWIQVFQQQVDPFIAFVVAPILGIAALGYRVLAARRQAEWERRRLNRLL